LIRGFCVFKHATISSTTARKLQKIMTRVSRLSPILRETSALRARPGYVGHPKMEMLRSICLEHFKSSRSAEGL
jgi:ERCC4-related helicase